ncbi:50S ribosomal protein L11 methyltransferase [Sulfitobacter sp. LCG007]
MPTYTAFTTLPTQAAADALAESMNRLDPEPYGLGVFELEDGSGLWEVGGYFTEAPDEVALMLLAGAKGAAPFAVSELPDQDWVAHVRRELSPVEAGRFFVHGSHDAHRIPDGAEPLLIEAAMAFGTGHHGTTLGCLRALDRLASEGFTGRCVADIGCGTAVLAMAAARIWPGTVLASDIDEVAIEVAATNIHANRLDDRVRCFVAEGFDHPVLRDRAPFDLIFANILKGPLIALAPVLCGSLQPGGRAILSGILNEQADDILAVYGDAGMELAHREVIGDWTTLTLLRAPS